MKLPQVLFLLGGLATVNLLGLSAAFAMEVEGLADVGGLASDTQALDSDAEDLIMDTQSLGWDAEDENADGNTEGNTKEEWCELQTFTLNFAVQEISSDLDALMSTPQCSLHRRARLSEILLSDFRVGLHSFYALNRAKCSIENSLLEKLLGIETSMSFLVDQVEREARMVSDPWLRRRLFESRDRIDPYLYSWADLCWSEILEL